MVCGFMRTRPKGSCHSNFHKDFQMSKRFQILNFGGHVRQYFVVARRINWPVDRLQSNQKRKKKKRKKNACRNRLRI